MARGGRHLCLGLTRTGRHRRQAGRARLQRLRLSGAARVSRCIKKWSGAGQGRRRSWAGARQIPKRSRVSSRRTRSRTSPAPTRGTDRPDGAGGKAKPAPYNFFYGPSYSDALTGRADLGSGRLEVQGTSRASRNMSIWAPTIPTPTHLRPRVKALAAELASRCFRRWSSR